MSVCAPTWGKQEALRRPGNRREVTDRGEADDPTLPGRGERLGGWMGAGDSRQVRRAGRRGCWGSWHLGSGPLPLTGLFKAA